MWKETFAINASQAHSLYQVIIRKVVLNVTAPVYQKHATRSSSWFFDMYFSYNIVIHNFIMFQATNLYRQQIPAAIIDRNHGFSLTTFDHKTIINDNFQLNMSRSEISYSFGPYPTEDRLFWSLPKLFTGTYCIFRIKLKCDQN